MGVPGAFSFSRSLPVFAFYLAGLCSGTVVQAAGPPNDCAPLLQWSPEPAPVPGQGRPDAGGAWVQSPVQGLYQSALVSEADLRTAGWTVSDSLRGGVGWGDVNATLRHHPIPGLDSIFSSGQIHRSAQLHRGGQGGGWVLSLEAAYLDDETALPDGRILKLPRWIDLPGVPSLSPGRGNPTIALFTLRQMRQMGIPYGGLRGLLMHQIENLATVFEIELGLRRRGRTPMDLAAGRVDAAAVDELLRRTHSLRYAETILVQSGHRIEKVSIRPGSGYTRTVAGFLEEAFENLPSGPPARAFDTAARYGISTSSPVFYEFDIQIEVEPLSAPHG